MRTKTNRTADIIEDLSEEEKYLWSILSDESGLDLAEFTWIDEEKPDGVWRAWNYQWAWFRCTDQQQIDQCIAEGSLVLTDRGQVPIEEVEIGDRVLTHRARWREVTWKWDRGERPLVATRGVHHFGIRTTADHQFLTEKGQFSAPIRGQRWVSPAHVEGLPRPALPYVYPSGRTNLPVNWFGPDMFWLMGLYLAEGSISEQKGGRKVRFSVHSREVDYVVKMIQKAGLRCYVETGTATCRNVVINSTPLANWLERNGEKLAYRKRLLPWVLAEPEENRRALFEGAIFGDGWERPNGRIEYTTVSRSLAIDLKILAQSLGCSASLLLSKKAGTQTILGRTVQCRDKYSLGIYPLSLQNKSRVKAKDCYHSAMITEVRPSGSGRVYDLEVDEDNSFVVEGVIVHNCGRSLGKSLSIKLRGFVFPFIHPGAEMVVTAPELNHLEPITDLIEQQFFATRLGRMMIATGRSGITHRPFKMNFKNGARIMGRIPQKDGKGVKGCLSAETPVWTSEGYKLAKDIRVGDLVLTHEGRYRPVFVVFEDENDCFEVRGAGSFPFEASCDHRFYGVENLSDGKRKREFTELAWHDIEDLIDHQVYWATPTVFPDLPVPAVERPRSGSAVEASGTAFWWLVGRYLADGHLAKKGRTSGNVNWSVTPAESDQILSRLTQVGLRGYVTKRDHSSADIISAHCSVWYRWLLEYFGKLADGKKLPPFVLSLEKVDRHALLDGYLSGDGHWNEANKRWEAGTASKFLACGLQLLAQSLDYQVNCTSVDPKVTTINGVSLKNKPKTSWRIHIPERGHAIRIGDYLVNKVKSVTPVGKQKVYDIRVEEDHSYLSGSIMSHNIHPVWLELDEAQDYPHPGWLELNETVKWGSAGHVWRAHGVTRGVHDDFWSFTQPGSDWKVHRFTAMHRPPPFWSDEEREKKINLYHGRENGDYRRNILGDHGDESSPIFNIHRLMACVDDNTETAYNSDEYVKYRIIDTWLRQTGRSIDQELDLPFSHTGRYKTFWAGMDVGFCVDEKTEILTQRGWLAGTQLTAGDKTLSINPNTGKSEWTIIDRVHFFDERPRKAVHIAGQSFDALTTPNHRWLVRDDRGNWRWKTTETLNTKDRIPLAVPRGDAPQTPVVSDDFVELVAWFWTEGNFSAKGSASICQSRTANPSKVDRIDRCVRALYGAPGRVRPGPYKAAGGPVWSVKDREGGPVAGMRYWRLSKPIATELKAVMQGPEKDVSSAFLQSLTVAQLRLFIEVSLLGDGWHGKKIEQRSEARIRSFEIACALAGLATSTSYDPKRCRWHLSILQASECSPVKAASFPRASEQAMKVTPVEHVGAIWCPVLRNSNWLARRNGSVYYTGNTNHPSEIVVFAEERMIPEEYKYYKSAKEFGRRKSVPRTIDLPRLKLIARVNLTRISTPDQEEAIMKIIKHYKPKAFAFDQTGAGLPMFQSIQRKLEDLPLIRTVVKGYNFSGNIIVDLDKTVDVSEWATKDEIIKETAIKRNAVDYATDCLRVLIDNGEFWLPWDNDPEDSLINEFLGQTYKVRTHSGTATLDQYGRREYSLGQFHALDACRMMALAHAQYGIEEFIKKDVDSPVLDLVL